MGPIPLLIALGMFINGVELVEFFLGSSVDQWKQIHEMSAVIVEYTTDVVFCGNHARDLQQMSLSVYNTSGSTALVAYQYGQTVDLQQTLRAVGSAALVVYQHGYAYVFAQPVCPVHRQYVLPVPTTVCPVPTEEECPVPEDETVDGTTQSWTKPVMVVPLLVMLLLCFWVIVVFYHKKKGVAKPTVPAEHAIDETVSAESEIAAPVIAEPVPEEPVIEEPLPVKPDSDTPARVGLSTTASADHRLEMFQFKMRLAKA